MKIAGLELWLHIVEGEQLPMTLMNGIRLFVHGQNEAVQKENSQHVTSLGFLNSFAIDYYVRQIFACCISDRSMANCPPLCLRNLLVSCAHPNPGGGGVLRDYSATVLWQE